MPRIARPVNGTSAQLSCLICPWHTPPGRSWTPIWLPGRAIARRVLLTPGAPGVMDGPLCGPQPPIGPRPVNVPPRDDLEIAVSRRATAAPVSSSDRMTVSRLEDGPDVTGLQ